MNKFRMLLTLLLLAPAWALAAPPSQAASEIERLIGELGKSSCEFQRNGTWYSASKAVSHLRRKYDWLRERDLVASAEQFIERAGTKSSVSGRVYQVRCPGEAAVPSADWLRTRLLEMRKRSHNPDLTPS